MNFPQVKYAALVKTKTHVPGDERSRTNPGHGYPEHWVDALDIIKFDTLDHLQKWAENENSQPNLKRDVTYIQYEELDVKFKTVVEVRTKKS